jgi:uncharacterized protein (TIGR04255 family)
VEPPTLSSSRKLVDFDAPPVSEVVLSVQFVAPVVDISVLALFTTAVREQAPEITHQPVLPRMEETFDRPMLMPPFQIVEQIAGLPRTWFSGPDGYLIQLQRDRLTLNWRRQGADQDYPGYIEIRRRFDGHVDQLCSAVAATAGREQLPPIDMCEVAYINPVEVPGPPREFMHPDLAAVINRIRTAPRRAYLGEPEDAQYQARWRIMHSRGSVQTPIGRLYLAATPHVAGDARSPLYLINLTAHVRPQEEPGFDALNLAHEYVVLGFKDLTTAKMQAYWRITEVSE